MEEIVQSLVNLLESHVSLQGCNISCDCFYTSISLVNWFLQQDIIVVGTIMTNWAKCWFHKVYWEKEKGKVSITFYIVSTESAGKKNILEVMTMPPC